MFHSGTSFMYSLDIYKVNGHLLRLPLNSRCQIVEVPLRPPPPALDVSPSRKDEWNQGCIWDRQMTASYPRKLASTS